MFIRYEGQVNAMRVNLIYAWDRGVEPIMSNSSGPKDCVRNWICALFDAEPDVERVEMVRGLFNNSEPFAIRRKTDGYWYSLKRKVEVEHDV